MAKPDPIRAAFGAGLAPVRAPSLPDAPRPAMRALETQRVRAPAAAASAKPFVHLHAHSSFSLLEGAMTVERLAALAVADAMPALALTDTNNLFGALEFSEKLAGKGVQPIIGVQASISGTRPLGGGREGRPGTTLPSVVMLAATAEGYAGLLRLVSGAHLRADGDAVAVALADLLAAPEGLILLTGGAAGPVDRALAAGKGEIARRELEGLRDAFGDRLYVELQRHGGANDRGVEAQLAELAYDLSLPLVATNDVYFAAADDHEAHDALLALAAGRVLADDDRRSVTPRHGFATRAEMTERFADLPEALENTVEVAKRCSYRPRLRKPILPRFTTAAEQAAAGGDALAAENAALRARAASGLDARLAAAPPAPGLTEDDYRKRLAFELDVIERMGFPGYFLIVSDFIQWAKGRNIPVGPGRGSGAGSLVAYALTITDLDPLRFGLLFERFLNPDRVSMPDFDVDFCQDRREEVIAYVQERYGRERVAQIITFGTLQPRGVMRDVGRVLEMPFGQVDKLAKLVPFNPAKPVTLSQALESEPKLRSEAESDERVGRMIAICRKLEGLHRHASTHAAGVVIGDRPLDELVPLTKDPRTGFLVTQFNMKWVEPAGLVKFDFLGLKTLTVLTTAVDLLRARGIEIDLSRIPLDDRPTYDLLSRGDTVGVFQVESAGMRRALVDMKPDRLEDIIALVALYRPGPMDNIPTYCARKHEREKPDYIHPALEDILKETFGVIIYQEQVMQIAQTLAGYSLGEADLLRRAMGKKIKSEMDAQRARFVDGAVKAKIPKAEASAIFDVLAKFADYGFNKSHAAAYALISYQTAYLKANYPVEFLAASMTLDMSNTDKLSEFRREAQRLGITVEPPSLNRSGVAFDVREGAIVYALAAVRGVGRPAAEALVASRGERPFRDLNDLAERLDARQVNKRTLESLVCAGAFDALTPDRARACAALDGLIACANRAREEREAGQNALFGLAGSNCDVPIPNVPAWERNHRLKKEYEAIGFYLSGHPLDEYASVLGQLRAKSWVEFCRDVREGRSHGNVAATILDRQEKRTRTGGKMGVIQASDPTGQFEAVVFSETLAELRDLLENGTSLLLQLSAAVDGDDVRARIVGARPIEEAARSRAAELRVFLRDDAALPSVAERLAGGGQGAVTIVVLLDGSPRSEVEIRLPGRFVATPQVASAIRAIPGVVEVETR